MFKTTEEVIENIELIMAQAVKVIKHKDFELGIVHIYYAGGTLCIDIYNNSKISFVVMVNINGEQFNVVDSNNGSETQRILPIEALKNAFNIYELIKGKTAYHSECLENSCLRHFDEPLKSK